MKKIVFLLLIVLSIPIGLIAQSNDDDLYFVPSKEKEKSAPVKQTKERRGATTHVYKVPGTSVVIQGQDDAIRDADEYNRRYDARDNEFVVEDDTLYVTEKEKSDLDGEWVNGEFNGSQDDYEYAERIIRFRNPRFAISVSSPLYWDIMYGGNSWDWNVYSDGFYAYAFPTFSNPLWANWRYNSWGWGGYYPYSSWNTYPGYWGGYYGGYYGGYWGNHWGHHHGGWYPGGGHGGHYWSGPNTYYNNRRSAGRSSDAVNSSRRSSSRDTYSRSSDGSTSRRSSSSYDRGGSTSRRVVGTRSSTYTRPSSTRSSGSSDSGTSRRSSSSYSGSNSSSGSSRSSSYSRGNSNSSSRSSYSTESSRRSSSSNSNSNSNSGSSSRSYSPSSSSRSSGGASSSGGGSSRSSGGGGGSSRSGSRR